MDSVIRLPFNQFLGLQPASTESGLLELPAAEKYLNHLGTVHASAQLALAEACSGEYLLKRLEGSEAPLAVVRRVEAKFKKPAHGRVVASVNEELTDIYESLADLTHKSRCLIAIHIDIHDEQGEHSLAASFEWFVSRNSNKA